jgi:hypothetical protein
MDTITSSGQLSSMRRNTTIDDGNFLYNGADQSRLLCTPEFRFRSSSQNLTMLHLSESDLRFLVETVSTSRREYDHVIRLIRDQPDLLEPMLEDRRLMNRLFQDEKTLVSISPYFLFSVLLRQVQQNLRTQTYILEVDSKLKRVPIFEAPAVAELLSNRQTRDYLAEMLASFARTNSGVIHWKERGSWHKRRFSDIDMDDMIELARIIDPEMRPALYRRIADIALFVSGIFPDHLSAFAVRHRSVFSAKRTLKDHEREGKRFYHLAAQETDRTVWRPALEALAENFTLARWALNTLGDRYLKTHRARYFRFPAESAR